MDTNRDGIIQRAEWRGSFESFRVHDWNRDGMLSGDELRVGQWREGSWEDVDFDPDDPDESIYWTEASFRSLDRNRNGVIARGEWPYDMATFFRIDRNRDNRISRAEFLGQAGWDDDRDDRFEDLDLNNNGRIERAEWHGSEEAFIWLDSNRNGWLSRAETTGNVNPRAATNADFRRIDMNNNGRITRDEWFWSRASFDERDRNRDGMLTLREFNSVSDATLARDNVTDIRVDPRERWTNTGIYVRTGDTVRLNATGTILMRQGDPNDIATAAGSRTGRRAENAIFRDQPAGALVGQIGGGAAFFIGNNGSFVAPQTGILYLGVNDDHLLDNSGEFVVSIDVLGR
jgi:Ca2+-binding EF-hand superfamily protein